MSFCLVGSSAKLNRLHLSRICVNLVCRLGQAVLGFRHFVFQLHPGS